MTPPTVKRKAERPVWLQHEYNLFQKWKKEKSPENMTTDVDFLFNRIEFLCSKQIPSKAVKRRKKVAVIKAWVVRHTNKAIAVMLDKPENLNNTVEYQLLRCTVTYSLPLIPRKK